PLSAFHSFPTRRSSDLNVAAQAAGGPVRGAHSRAVSARGPLLRVLAGGLLARLPLSLGRRGGGLLGHDFARGLAGHGCQLVDLLDRKSTRLNSSHVSIS